MKFSPDSLYLAVLGSRGRSSATDQPRPDLSIWNTETGRALTPSIELEPGNLSFDISPDGRNIAFSGDRLTIYELASGQRRLEFAHPGYYPRFSPDGRLLAATSQAVPITLWDVRGERARPAAVPQQADLQQAWADLASDDPRKGFQAVRLLAGFPAVSLPLLRDEVARLPVASPELIAGWIKQLDSPAFAEREQATKELKRVADVAANGVRAAVESSKSPELLRRGTEILVALERPSTPTLRLIRAVEAVEWIGTPDARELLRDWSGKRGRLAEESKAALARLERGRR
jgi:hypothetical protein